MVHLDDKATSASYIISLLPECGICGSRDLTISGIATDSSEAGPNILFIPIIGARVDGHDYISESYDRGSRVFLLGKHRHNDLNKLPGYMKDSLYLCVDDTLQALQQMAGNHLLCFPNIKRIGITGSSGKTTTKECLAAIMSQMGNIIYTQGNLNSDIGLPLSIMTVGPEHDFAVFELGMNREGEMDLLVDLLRPTTAIITNIGSAHIGQLGSKDAIAREKRKILRYVQSAEAAVFWEHDQYLDYLKEGLKGRPSLFGPDCMPQLTRVKDYGLSGSELEYRGVNIRLSLPGSYNVLNALAAIKAAELFGALPLQIKMGLEIVQPLFGRGQVSGGRVSVFSDCYNANPESMKASILFFNSVKEDGRAHYVLGAMKELGKDTEAVHQNIGDFLHKELKGSCIYLFGAEMQAAYQRLSEHPGVFFSTDLDELLTYLLSAIAPGDRVLLKGSRSTGLEKIADAINKEFNQDCVEGAC